MGKLFLRAAAAALVMTIALPAAAQNYSEGYEFLKAVREHDGNKATDLLNHPGTTVVNARDSSGDAAIHIVTRNHDGTWLSFLLSKGARPDMQNSKGETALSLAAQLGWSEGAEILLSRGAGVDLANQRGETPLILAVQAHNLQMARLLLSHGANPTKTDHVTGYSALDYAKQDSHDQALARLLETKSGGAARP
ncbi:MAG TPA: ankyrin repeat domain-containing protein [Allosphingosinicella sp.]|nr:ankyrin repeat domain-containing protein [Allosphingosinicella sp.]